MSDPDAAAWAQAWISGVAIIVSGAIAVFVPWNEKRLEKRREARSRLSASAARSVHGGLKVRISFRPEFLNSAIGATLKVLAPPGAYVYTDDSVYSPSQGTVSKNLGLASNPTINGVSLTRVIGSDPIEYEGFLIVTYPDERAGPNRISVEIDVLIHGNRLIQRTKLIVSPIGEVLWPGNVPNILLDQR